MKYLVTLLLIGLAESCAPKAIPVAPIAPQAARVRTTAETTARTAANATRSAEVAQRHAAATADAVTRGNMEADRMARAGTATAAELAENARLWNEAWKSAQQSVIHAGTLMLDARELESAAQKTAAESATMETEAIKTDKATEELKTEIAKQTDNAALGKALKKLIWIGVIFAILGLLVWAFIKLAPLIIKATKPL